MKSGMQLFLLICLISFEMLVAQDSKKKKIGLVKSGIQKIELVWKRIPNSCIAAFTGVLGGVWFERSGEKETKIRVALATALILILVQQWLETKTIDINFKNTDSDFDIEQEDSTN
jgi:hypothetical protein